MSWNSSRRFQWIWHWIDIKCAIQWKIGRFCMYLFNHEVTVRFRCAKSDRFAWIVLLYVINIDLVIFRYHHRPSVIDMTTNVYFICVFFALFDKWALCYEVFVIKKYRIVKYPVLCRHNVIYSSPIGQYWPTVVINLYNLLVHLTTFYADTIITKISMVYHGYNRGQSVL